MSNRWLTRSLCAVALALCGAPVLAAGEGAGRFTMSPAEGGGFVRLDTETGQMALCQRRNDEWSCREMAEPGGGLSQEIERLRAENSRLKAELSQRENRPLAERGPGAEGQPRQFKLPTEQEIDAAMTYAQRLYRKFREKLKELETESKGTPL